MTAKHPVIVYTLERKIIGDAFLHTLVLADPDFYEQLNDCDWAGAEFQLVVEESNNGSLPDGPGLWTAEFRIDNDVEFGPQLVQETPWRPLNDKEAWRFAQGMPIAEVLLLADPKEAKPQVWAGQCGKCGTCFEQESDSGPPFHRDGKSVGAFCSECRSRGYTWLGVVHFIDRLENFTPKEEDWFVPKIVIPASSPSKSAHDGRYNKTTPSARQPEDAARVIAGLQAETARLQGTIDDLREQIAEELNQEPPARKHNAPP